MLKSSFVTLISVCPARRYANKSHNINYVTLAKVLVWSLYQVFNDQRKHTVVLKKQNKESLHVCQFFYTRKRIATNF